jgi:hypothetical protein
MNGIYADPALTKYNVSQLPYWTSL